MCYVVYCMPGEFLQQFPSGDPRKKIAMARSRHKNGWSTHSKASITMGSRRIQEKTWKTKDKLNKDLQRMGLTWEEVKASAQHRQT